MMADKVNALGIASHVCSDSPAPGITFLGAVYASGRRSWQVWRPAASFLLVLVSPSPQPLRRCPWPCPRPGVLGEVRRAPGPPQGRPGSPAAPPLCRWDRTGSMSCSFLFLSVAGLHSSLAPLTNEICRWRLRTGGNFSLCSNTSFVRRCFLSYNSCNVRIWI